MARSKRSRCSSNDSVIRILPIGDPMALRPNPRESSSVAEVGVLGLGKVQDVDAVDRAELDVLDAMRDRTVDLLAGVLGDLVGEGTDADHRSFPRSRHEDGLGRIRTLPGLPGRCVGPS